MTPLKIDTSLVQINLKFGFLANSRVLKYRREGQHRDEIHEIPEIPKALIPQL